MVPSRLMGRRIDPPEPSTIAEDTKKTLDFVARFGPVPATIELLAHSPQLLGPFLGWAGSIARSGTLSPRHHEVLALRIAHLVDSSYEWAEHRRIAAAAGLTAEEIESIASHPHGDGLSDTDRALLDAADELHRTATLTPEAFDRLAATFGPAELVEIPLVVGQYAMLSMLCGVAGLTVDDAEH